MVRSHVQDTVDPRTGKGDTVLLGTFFVGAFHAEFGFHLLGPRQRDFSRCRQTQ